MNRLGRGPADVMDAQGQQAAAFIRACVAHIQVIAAAFAKFVGDSERNRVHGTSGPWLDLKSPLNNTCFRGLQTQLIQGMNISNSI